MTRVRIRYRPSDEADDGVHLRVDACISEPPLDDDARQDGRHIGHDSSTDIFRVRAFQLLGDRLRDDPKGFQCRGTRSARNGDSLRRPQIPKHVSSSDLGACRIHPSHGCASRHAKRNCVPTETLCPPIARGEGPLPCTNAHRQREQFARPRRAQLEQVGQIALGLDAPRTIADSRSRHQNFVPFENRFVVESSPSSQLASSGDTAQTHNSLPSNTAGPAPTRNMLGAAVTSESGSGGAARSAAREQVHLNLSAEVAKWSRARAEHEHRRDYLEILITQEAKRLPP